MKVQIVCPIFNEEEVLPTFLIKLDEEIKKIENTSNVQFGITLVDDGSTDETLKLVHDTFIDTRINLIKLSRNFGHQNAVWAGLESVDGDSNCIVMDADLQDPVEEISNILREFEAGHNVVLMQRESRRDSHFKKLFASLFYRFHSWLTGGSIPKNVGDFFGLSPQALKALMQHQESVKYIRGLVAELGFNRKILKYKRQVRFSGKTHYTIPKMFSLAVAGITGFSIAPLIWVVYSSVIGTFVGIIFITYAFILKLSRNNALTPGWTFSVVSSTLFSVITLLALSVISVYLARITQELKKRPIYLIDETHTETETQ